MSCRRRAARLATAALLLVALAAAPPAAAQIDIAMAAAVAPLTIKFNNESEHAALQLAIRAAVDIASAFAEGREPEMRVSAASAAPPEGVTPAMLGLAMGQVLAAASMDSEALSTLGDPQKMPMGWGDRHALYRLPQRHIRVRGTCVFVHGCYHSPESWFYHSPRCPLCTGLPEEVAHTKQCLARGYAVLAVASKDRSKTMCFSSSGNPDLSDHQDVRKAILEFTGRFNLRGKPVYMWGISSGAAFTIKFPATMWVDGLVSEVNMPWEKNWGATDGNGRLKIAFPPTAYYMMQRDLQTKRQIEKAVDILRRNGVYSDYVFVPSIPVYSTIFFRRSIYITPQQSAIIVAGLKMIGAIDRNTGWLNYDPRIVPKWLVQLPKVVPWLDNRSPYYNLNTDESQITEIMNYAWAWHEIVGDHVRPTLMWLEARGRANLTQLCEIYSLEGNLRCLTESREGCPGIEPKFPKPPSPPPRPRPPRPPPPKPKPKRPPPPKPRMRPRRPPPPRPPRPPRPPPPRPRRRPRPPPRPRPRPMPPRPRPRPPPKAMG